MSRDERKINNRYDAEYAAYSLQYFATTNRKPVGYFVDFSCAIELPTLTLGLEFQRSAFAMVDRLDRLAATIKTLEDKLQPFVALSVGRTQTGWLERSRSQAANSDAAVDRADCRVEAEAALAAALDLYMSGTDGERAALRALFRACDGFAWAAPLPDGPMTLARVRTQLLVYSIRDQGRDWREAMLWLDDLCAAAHRAGLAVVGILTEVAALSNDDIPFEQFRMERSTRKMLRDYAERYQARGTPTRT